MAGDDAPADDTGPPTARHSPPAAQPPRLASVAPDDGPVELSIEVGLDRVRVRLEGLRAAPSHDLPGVRIYVGESPAGPLHLDICRCPDVLTITGHAAARERIARSLLDQCDHLAAALRVTVVGRRLTRPLGHIGGDEPDPADRRHVVDRLDQLAPHNDPTTPCLVFCAADDADEARQLRRLVEESRGILVPVVIGDIPPARWSLHAEPSSPATPSGTAALDRADAVPAPSDTPPADHRVLRGSPPRRTRTIWVAPDE
ncbi:hypothetical protein KZZ52_15200 [Dactylosporangium sp. AC04546]|uniref:hypothetical protein n=1 Tax=Dactylosporangium sp. AC04546 TaxID=2862460 RepID=UPI001EDFA92D|nr:hypothetical protein [Dactylosporangium sp. AC04546]WVK86653.1 hypothetical protein KZZ52_15200 [Dactylosporangium sp. AC04546]